MITRARANGVVKEKAVPKKISKRNKKGTTKKKSMSDGRDQYMTPAARRTDAAIVRMIQNQKSSDSPIPPILMFNPWVSPPWPVS